VTTDNGRKPEWRKAANQLSACTRFAGAVLVLHEGKPETVRERILTTYAAWAAPQSPKPDDIATIAAGDRLVTAITIPLD